MNYNAQKEMANRIKQRRKSLKYTQEQFAELLGISANSYTRIENAFQRPALNTLIRIAQHLDLSLDYIVFGSDKDKPYGPIDTDIFEALLNNADKDKLIYASKFLLRIAEINGK